MPPNNPLSDKLFWHFHKQALLLLNCVLRVEKKKQNKNAFDEYEGWFPPILTFKFCYSILVCCYSVFLGILLCSFESYYSLSNSVIHFSDFIMPLRIFFIQFPILLFAFELCYAVFQSYYSTVQSSHVVSNPIISFQILLVTFPILLCHYEFF